MQLHSNVKLVTTEHKLWYLFLNKNKTLFLYILWGIRRKLFVISNNIIILALCEHTWLFITLVTNTISILRRMSNAYKHFHPPQNHVFFLRCYKFTTAYTCVPSNIAHAEKIRYPREADSCSACQDISRLLWNPEVHFYDIHHSVMLHSHHPANEPILWNS